MTKLLSASLVILLLVSLTSHHFAQQAGVGGSAFHKNDITYSTEVATPHVAWATRLPGGPIKGFFIPSVQYGRDMVELMQRLSLSPTTVSIDRNWDTNCWESATSTAMNSAATATISAPSTAMSKKT